MRTLQDNIDEACAKGLAECQRQSPIPFDVAWQNMGLDHVSTYWVQETQMPALPSVAALGKGGSNWHTGIYMLNVFGPIAEGRKSVATIVDHICNTFGRDKVLKHGEAVVMFDLVAPLGGRRDGALWQVPIEVHYRCHMQTR